MDFIFHGCVRVWRIRKIIYKIHMEHNSIYNKCRNEKPAETTISRVVQQVKPRGGGKWHHINLRANKINKRRVFGDSPVEMPNNGAGRTHSWGLWNVIGIGNGEGAGVCGTGRASDRQTHTRSRTHTHKHSSTSCMHKSREFFTLAALIVWQK